ncbi:hypothetical protein GALMADRAFT_238322 [Galerina marginata CBS 339.88]|uniref:Uncharacterized protein n=1 Tax=Galerina marginata (strain CBS 339.88) TaxID=685588 RepID=A0A067TUW6_GALM3|nr:hypothetical protein GALMADRAFT_238322 [Galerina marginata CBS 339.88]
MSTINPSAMLAESLSEFSKAAYQAFSEVESQSRMEVARAAADTREAKTERDKAFKELHSCQLEAQSWKQEAGASKSALAQAELTIAHQADSLAVQLETISQLRREVTQWKDQSRNWQEHFLRVEQERCAQSSRIDELVVERLQYPSSRVNSTALFTPKASKYTSGVNSAPSSTTKRQSIPSPTQPPEYKSAAPPSPLDSDPFVGPQTAQIISATQKRSKGTTKPPKQIPQQEQEVSILHANGELEDSSSASVKRPRKSNTSVQSAQKADSQASSVRSTVIRRVQAIVQVKREDDSEEDESPEISTVRTSVALKKKEESIDQQRYLRTPRPGVIHYDADDGVSDGSASGSGSDDGHGQGNRHRTQEKGRFRQRSRINYREDDDEDEEEDELMMGAEENHDEVYGTQKVEIHDSKSSKKQSIGPSTKKRKLAAR